MVSTVAAQQRFVACTRREGKGRCPTPAERNSDQCLRHQRQKDAPEAPNPHVVLVRFMVSGSLEVSYLKALGIETIDAVRPAVSTSTPGVSVFDKPIRCSIACIKEEIERDFFLAHVYLIPHGSNRDLASLVLCYVYGEHATTYFPVSPGLQEAMDALWKSFWEIQVWANPEQCPDDSLAEVLRGVSSFPTKELVVHSLNCRNPVDPSILEFKGGQWGISNP